MYKVLAVGNSFSQDCTAYIEKMTDQLFVRNLYVGGCSLEQHCSFIKTGEPVYDYEQNGEKLKSISLKDALLSHDWNAVTLQQASPFSGLKDTYYPHLTELISFIREYLPNAEIIINQTWAYEKGSPHDAFPTYNCDQNLMFSNLKDAYDYAAKKENLRIIRTGEFIQKLRKKKPFIYENGGLSLCRDSYHLSLEYGRYAAALTWCRFFNAQVNDFVPDNAEKEILNMIKLY